MLLKKISGLLLLVLLFTACGQAPPTEAEAPANEEQEGKIFGENINLEGAIPYAQLAEKMGDADSIQIKVQGTVNEVCQKKGCWMTIVKDNGSEGEELFVKFKDYGFFVPFDISGRQIVMDGYAYREVTSVEELKHYAEDGKEPQEVIDAITEPKEEFKFLASGVLLLDEKK